MICDPCLAAGRELAKGNPGLASVLHDQCPSFRVSNDGLRVVGTNPTQCTCQHQTDRSYLSRQSREAS